MQRLRPTMILAYLAIVALLSTGCLIVSESNSTETGCHEDCYDYEVVETYCDAWSCWDEYRWETTCTTTCDSVYYPDPNPGDQTPMCYSDLDCSNGNICIQDQCVRADTDARGSSGLCQTCETRHDCIEEDARCIRINFDPVSNTGEKVCARDCDYNHECPIGFECVNISDEPGVPAQCLPLKEANEKRTCNPNAELQCVRANDCAMGESCVNNECKGPDTAECSSSVSCPSGQECRNFACVDATEPGCIDRSDCRNNELCIDAECVRQTETCVFNEECDTDSRCVDGQCVSTCSEAADCGSNERCRQGLCEVIECRRSADCAAGHVCVEASCEKRCTNNAECGAGYLCSPNDFCVEDPNVECRSTAECARDEICTAGSCETPCNCNQQCPESQVCNDDNGLCEDPNAGGTEPPATECENDCDCPSGLSCTEGACG
ncbi:MAG: hypothetical protein ACNA8W_07715 [Bradymonadaceae bacterium]